MGSWATTWKITSEFYNSTIVSTTFFYLIVIYKKKNSPAYVCVFVGPTNIGTLDPILFLSTSTVLLNQFKIPKLFTKLTRYLELVYLELKSIKKLKKYIFIYIQYFKIVFNFNIYLDVWIIKKCIIFEIIKIYKLSLFYYICLKDL